MSENNNQKAADPLRVELKCQLLPGEHHFTVAPHITVSQLLEQILTYLQQSEAAEQTRTLLEYNHPELQLVTNEGTLNLDHQLSLHEAGFHDGALCCIMSSPRKAMQSFCRWCSGNTQD